MKILLRNSILIGVLLATVVGCGCGGHVDDHLTTSDVKSADHLDELANKCNGNFDKLSEKDKQYVLDLEMGSEMSARMVLKAKARQIKGQGGAPEMEKPKVDKKG